MIKVHKTYDVLPDKGDTYEDIKYDYTIQLRLNQNCNLKCDYCHWNDGGVWEYPTIISILDRVYDFFEKNNFSKTLVFLHGGESTIHPRFLDIVKYIKSKLGSDIELQTNLTSTEMSDMMPYVDKFSVSLHYNELMKNNLLGIFEKNMQMIPEIFHFDVMLESVQDKDSYYRFIRKFLDKSIKSEFIYNYMGGYNCFDEHEEFIKTYNKTEQQYEVDGVIYNTNQLFENISFEGMRCFEPSKQTYINGDGNVYICPSGVPSKISSPQPYINILTDKHFILKLNVARRGYICKWDQCLGCFYSEKEIVR